jgi:hypothetical protein
MLVLVPITALPEVSLSFGDRLAFGRSLPRRRPPRWMGETVDRPSAAKPAEASPGHYGSIWAVSGGNSKPHLGLCLEERLDAVPERSHD